MDVNIQCTHARLAGREEGREGGREGGKVRWCGTDLVTEGEGEAHVLLLVLERKRRGILAFL